MAVCIRLRRGGTKKRPYYRIVAADTRFPRDGRFVEVVGTYHPLEQPVTIELKGDRIREYLDKGATVSTTVASILRDKGLALPSSTRKAEKRARKRAKAKAAQGDAKPKAKKAPAKKARKAAKETS